MAGRHLWSRASLTASRVPVCCGVRAGPQRHCLDCHNVVGHGFGPNGTLTVNNAGTPVVLPAGGRGFDQDGNGAITSSEGSSTSIFSPQASIGSRDALQQTTADLMQLVRAIQGASTPMATVFPTSTPTALLCRPVVGGIYGTMFLGIESDVRAGVPNVPGGSIIDIVRMSPGFRPLLGAIFWSGHRVLRTCRSFPTCSRSTTTNRCAMKRR